MLIKLIFIIKKLNILKINFFLNTLSLLSLFKIIFNEQNSFLKKLFDYANEDIEILKGKIENLDDSIKKLRIEVFKGINQTEEFLEKKYDSIYRIINKVN